jgi:hypothetical protein
VAVLKLVKLLTVIEVLDGVADTLVADVLV